MRDDFRIAVAFRQKRDPAFTIGAFIEALKVTPQHFYRVLGGDRTSPRVERAIRRFIQEEWPSNTLAQAA